MNLNLDVKISKEDCQSGALCLLSLDVKRIYKEAKKMTMQGVQPGQRRARRGEQWALHAQQKLQSAGFTLITPHEDEERSYSELIIAHQHEVDLVIVGGGDGTLNARALEVFAPGKV